MTARKDANIFIGAESGWASNESASVICALLTMMLAVGGCFKLCRTNEARRHSCRRLRHTDKACRLLFVRGYRLLYESALCLSRCHLGFAARHHPINISDTMQAAPRLTGQVEAAIPVQEAQAARQVLRRTSITMPRISS